MRYPQDETITPTGCPASADRCTNDTRPRPGAVQTMVYQSEEGISGSDTFHYHVPGIRKEEGDIHTFRRFSSERIIGGVS